MKRHERLLVRMRASGAGWRPRDFRALYLGFGFNDSEHGPHTKYRHPTYPHLWTMVKRAYPMSKAYAAEAVALIDELLRLEEKQ